MRKVVSCLCALLVAVVMVGTSLVPTGPATASDRGDVAISVPSTEAPMVLAMSPIPGAGGGTLVQPAQQCRYAYYNGYQRRQCYVCWYSYGRQYCEWRWY
jgi:hypothetical protein